MRYWGRKGHDVSNEPAQIVETDESATGERTHGHWSPASRTPMLETQGPLRAPFGRRRHGDIRIRRSRSLQVSVPALAD
jgi:hypothetical protein